MFKNIPIDLRISLSFIVLTVFFVLVPPFNSSALRIFFGIVFVLFMPGYLLIAALFPKNDELSGIERIALSFGLTIAVVPLIGLALNFTPFGIRLEPILASLVIYSLILLYLAYYRRSKLPEQDRFRVPLQSLKAAVEKEFDYKTTSKTDRFLTVVLLFLIILSIGLIVFVISTPKIGERFTEFYILDMKGKASDYPTVLKVGKPAELIVGVANHEYGDVNYSFRVELNDSVLTVREFTLAHNETWEQPVMFVPDRNGTDLKLQFLLFKENNFTDPYRSLHLWVNVTAGN